MKNDLNPNNKSGKTIIGFILLAVGCVFLLQSLDLFFVPRYFFSFPMLLIVIGLYIGARKGYQKPVPFILILLGILFLSDKIIDGVDMSRFVWPMAIIGLGLWIILKPKKVPFGQNQPEWDKRVDPVTGEESYSERPFDANARESSHATSDDYLNSTSVFGGVKKNVVSKDFKGGEIICFFGGSEINLMQADITGRVRMEVTQVFGGTKIIAPANWTIHSEMTAIFGGIEDKRLQANDPNPEKVLIIEGTSVFGGIDIRSF